MTNLLPAWRLPELDNPGGYRGGHRIWTPGHKLPFRYFPSTTGPQETRPKIVDLTPVRVSIHPVGNHTDYGPGCELWATTADNRPHQLDCTAFTDTTKAYEAAWDAGLIGVQVWEDLHTLRVGVFQTAVPAVHQADRLFQKDGRMRVTRVRLTAVHLLPVAGDLTEMLDPVAEHHVFETGDTICANGEYWANDIPGAWNEIGPDDMDIEPATDGAAALFLTPCK